MFVQLNASVPGFCSRLDRLLRRDTAGGDEIDRVVREIIANVVARRDDAVVGYTRELDGVVLTPGTLELPPEKIRDLDTQTDPEVRRALEAAASRIRGFHEREQLASWSYTEPDGTVLGQKITPLERVGIYVPGGKAAYPSSVLMAAIPARVAGVDEIVMTVPTPGGEINPVVISAARIAGVDRIFTVGGAQAIAALAYGTETIPAVDKIVGPGNAYVATAKKMVFGRVGIDMIAGPSEVVVIADHSADPEWVAMDLFAQSEHDELAQAIAIVPDSRIAGAINRAARALLPGMERRHIIDCAVRDNGAVICTDSLEQAVAVSNHIAPEHLELMVADADSLLPGIRNAGAVFVGKFSAEALGDYCAGPNHVLPTSGTARFSSPLGVYDFQKRSSILAASEQGAREMSRIATVLARSEGLTAHERAAAYRGTG